MSDIIHKALADRDKYEVSYISPSPGINDEGKEVTGMEKITLSITNAINLSRYVAKEVAPSKWNKCTDEQLLEDFMVVNWAQISEK